MTEAIEARPTCQFCATPLSFNSTFCSNCGAPRHVEEHDITFENLQRLFGRDLRIERELGRGGSAVVFAAYDPALERRVAVKALLTDDGNWDADTRERFQREARTVACLQHQNVVSVFGVRADDELSAIVMQYVEGRSLDAALRDAAPFPLSVAGLVLSQVAAGLQHAHDRGIVHRDVKPANVLLANDGLAVVSDFGIARREGLTRMTATGVLVGTFSYMSPEQIDGGTVGPASDRYSFGVLAFELLTGRLPFGGTLPRVLNAHLNEEPPSIAQLRPDLPPAVSSYVMRLMAKNVEERPANLRDARRIFLSLVPDETAAATEIVSISHVRAGVRSARQAPQHIAAQSAPPAALPLPPEASPIHSAGPAIAASHTGRRLGVIAAALLVITIAGAGATWVATSRGGSRGAVPSTQSPEVAGRGSTPPASPSTASNSQKPVVPAPVRSTSDASKLKRAAEQPATTADAPSQPSGAPVTVPTDSATLTAAGTKEEPKPQINVDHAAGVVVPPAPSEQPVISATLADARSLAREFVTLCNQRQWRELEALGSLPGDGPTRSDVMRLVRNAAEFAAGFDRVASAPVVAADGFLTEFVLDLEWRGGKRLALIRLQARYDRGAWRLASFGAAPAE